jgi:predicted SAM-dependent methyltransferase
LLIKLAGSGFNHLFGIDPFIEDDIVYDLPDNKRINIYKKELFDLEEVFDIIMLNHSLEHMLEQEKVLAYVNSILSETGVCIIRIPTVSSYLWKKYRENWYSLDAPRHIFLHSIDSINRLCQKCGFRVLKITYDSLNGTAGCKAYKKGWNNETLFRFLYSPIGVFSLVKDRLFSKYLNGKYQGDNIRIYLEKQERYESLTV